MVMAVRTRALVFLGLIAVAHPAAAQSIADTASRWGLIGTWALDCSQPASGSNGYLVYIARGAKVSHERNFGDRRDVNDVREAKAAADGGLELVVHFPGLQQTRRFILIKGPDGRIRATSNSKADGTEPTILDGRFTANGNPTPWQVRCK